MVCSFSMTSSSRLRGRRALLPSLSPLVACSAGKPLDQDPNFGVVATGATNAGGTSGSAALGQAGSSASGQGGSSATGQGGSSATGGTSGSAATGGTDTGSGGTPS